MPSPLAEKAAQHESRMRCNSLKLEGSKAYASYTYLPCLFDPVLRLSQRLRSRIRDPGGMPAPNVSPLAPLAPFSETNGAVGGPGYGGGGSMSVCQLSHSGNREDSIWHCAAAYSCGIAAGIGQRVGTRLKPLRWPAAPLKTSGTSELGVQRSGDKDLDGRVSICSRMRIRSFRIIELHTRAAEAGQPSKAQRSVLAPPQRTPDEAKGRNIPPAPGTPRSPFHRPALSPAQPA